MNVTQIVKQLFHFKAELQSQDLKSSQIDFHHQSFQRLISSPKHTRTSTLSTDIINLLEIPPQYRSKKAIAAIKSQLQSLKMFEMQHDKNIDLITKKEDSLFLNILCYFIQLKYFPKGSIIQLTGRKRKTVKILYYGNAIIYEPLNSKSLKDSITRVKENQLPKIKNLLEDNSQKIRFIPEIHFLKLLYEKHILSTYINPHRFTTRVASQYLICQNRWLDKLNFQFKQGIQALMYLPEIQNLTCICPEDCIVFEVPYVILTKMISLLPNHTGLDLKKRPYLRAFLKITKQVEGFEYLHIIKYICHQYMMQFEQKNQFKPSNQYFFMLIQGQVTIQMLQEGNKRNLVTLYNIQFFGFENQLFQNNFDFSYCLDGGSKCLKIQKKLLETHERQIKAFHSFMKVARDKRKVILQRLLISPEQHLRKNLQKIRQKARPTKQQQKALSRSIIVNLKQDQNFQIKDQNQEIKNRKLDIASSFNAPQISVIQRRKSLSKNNPEEIHESLTFINKFLFQKNSNYKIEGNKLTVFADDGRLLRKVNIDKNDTQKDVLRKIGLLDAQYITKSNKKLEKQRNKKRYISESKIQIQAKKHLVKRYSKVAMSLPKLKYFSIERDRMFKMTKI